jgi:anti-sigma-K factor RskA
VNPQFHDEFVALYALFYAGELSEEEWALLQIHMAYCDSCHDRFLEYQRLTSDVIPAMAAHAASESDTAPEESDRSIEEAERRLMNQLSAPNTPQELPLKKEVAWRLPAALLAACLVGVACLAGAHFMRMSRHASVEPHSDAVLQVQQAQAAPSTQEGDIQQALERSQQEAATLRQQLNTAENQFKQSRLTTAGVEKQLEAEQTQRNRINEDRETLNQQLAAAQAEVKSLRDNSSSASAEVNQQAAQVAALEAKVHELNDALDEKNTALNDKDRMLALDKDFLAHDRDIRDLIGARNLYIADIFDMTENGKTAKPFGRIFYTKDRSLVFYGFDLDKQPDLKQSVSFQVWGSGSDKSAVNLGLFYQDDTHKRWVLRCNDAKTLARLNMVFVTVEPAGGSARPTGKQLLRAYLQIQPNHL